jgi:hypothetical protein
LPPIRQLKAHSLLPWEHLHPRPETRSAPLKRKAHRRGASSFSGPRDSEGCPWSRAWPWLWPSAPAAISAGTRNAVSALTRRSRDALKDESHSAEIPFMRLRGLLGISVVGLSVALGGCAYHGTLRPGFYAPREAPAKVALRAALVVGENVESLEYEEHFAWGHSVHLVTSPALKQALAQATASLFDHVDVVQTAAQGSTADVVLLPTVELREHVLYMKVAARNPESGETLAEYEASGNMQTSTPTTVTLMAVLNGVFCGLLTPITAPIATHSWGTAAEATLERRLASNVRQITEEIANDRALVARATGARPRDEASRVPERFSDARDGAHRE